MSLRGEVCILHRSSGGRSGGLKYWRRWVNMGSSLGLKAKGPWSVLVGPLEQAMCYLSHQDGRETLRNHSSAYRDWPWIFALPEAPRYSPDFPD